MNFVFKQFPNRAQVDGIVNVMPERLSQGSPADAYIKLARRRGFLTKILFWLAIVFPTVVAIIFYSLVVAPRYVSEARFIVRSVSSPQITGLDVLFRTIGIAKTADDAYVIEKYLLSRDAITDLKSEGVNLREIFSRPEADVISRYPYFWRKDSNEALYDFYASHVSISEDAVKGIVRLEVTAFRPDDAHAVAGALLRLSEKMVNKINGRAQKDTIETAHKEVDRAEARVTDAQANLTDFRNEQLIVDPQKSSTNTLETIGKLTVDKIAALAQLQQLAITAPQNPTIPSLKARVKALENGIAAQQQQLTGGDSAIAGKLERYEQLILQRDLADKLLTGSLQSLDEAMREARRQHIYVEQVVRPNLPDYANQPRRLKSIVTVLVLGIALFSIGWVLMVGAGEHLH